MEFDFSNIRYFTDEEFVNIIPSLRDEPAFRRVANYMQGGISDEEYQDLFSSLQGVHDFQMKLILRVLERIE